jgi:hypothetical protein
LETKIHIGSTNKRIHNKWWLNVLISIIRSHKPSN